jgi:GTP-binding protein HflX
MRASTGGYVDPADVIGRDALIEQIWQILDDQSLVLTAERRIGKTTILNALSGEHRSTADRLFETLETTTRLVAGSPGNHENARNGEASARPDIVLTDTVGFIRKLPTQLVHSFASTLEAAAAADIVVLCADASSEKLEEEIQTVRETLASTLFEVDGEGERRQETVLCLNKSDILSEDRRRELRLHYPGAVLISARQDASPLLDAINEVLAKSWVRMRLLIPHAEYGLVSSLYGRAEIHARDDTAQGTELDVTLPEPQVDRYAHYRTA